MCIRDSPYRAKGWNREFIYDLMGFDYRYFQGSFPFEDKLRNYVSDEADFKSILEWRNNTEGPFFMFNVTMQNHSNYGGDFDNFDPQIVAKFKNTYSNKYLNKYLSLMYETDQDVASLLSELSQSDRKTIVVFWGDHQPNDYVAVSYTHLRSNCPYDSSIHGSHRSQDCQHAPYQRTSKAYRPKFHP